MSSEKGTERHALFKREARNYDFYASSVKRLEDNLTVLVYRLENVHSVPLDQEPMTPTHRERPLIKMLEKKEEIEAQMAYYTARLEWIHKVIEHIPSPAYRAVSWRTFIQRKSLHEIADKYEISQDRLYRLRKHFIEMALTDELIEEYNSIVNPLGTLAGEDEEEEFEAKIREDTVLVADAKEGKGKTGAQEDNDAASEGI